MKTKLIKLPHGGKILYTPITEVNGIQCEMHFGCGSWNDEKGKGGTAHFAEHVLAGFPTSKHTKEQRFEKARSFQSCNAGTGKGDMFFFFTTIKTHFDEVIDHITETFDDVVITEECFEKERNIILDELRTRVKMNYDEYYQKVKAKLTTQENISQSICIGGTEESVKALTIDDIKTFIDKYITLENLVMTVTGNISQKQMMNAVKKYIIPRLKKEGDRPFSIKDVQQNYWIAPQAIVNKSVEQGKAMLLFSYPLRFAPYTGNILDQDYCRRIVSPFLRKQMHEKLRIEGGLCYSCSSFVFPDDAMFVCEDTIEVAEENLDKLIDQYFDYLKCLPKDLDPEFFEREKRKIVESENLDFDRLFSINARTFRFFDEFGLLYSSKYRNYDIEQIQKLTYQQVNELYKSIYTQKPFIVIYSNDEKYIDKKTTNKLYTKLKKIKPW